MKLQRANTALLGDVRPCVHAVQHAHPPAECSILSACDPPPPWPHGSYTGMHTSDKLSAVSCVRPARRGSVAEVMRWLCASDRWRSWGRPATRRAAPTSVR